MRPREARHRARPGQGADRSLMTEPRPIPIVACLAGDGIGPEVMAEAGRVIEAVSSLMGVRELTGGLYFGEKVLTGDSAFDTCSYSREQIERVARWAFRLAKRRSGRVVSVDKANVLATSKLWRAVVTDLHAAEAPELDLSHELVDSFAMNLATRPASYDVILTENLFGDILSD